MTAQMKKSEMDSLIDKRKGEWQARAVCVSESHGSIKVALLAQFPSIIYKYPDDQG